ncbi:MAG: glycosyltransferase family 2 protein [Candidatus Omnitrophica bacterium]|nr:glycosyltransferase family 2 protein [Candidatus Omnitrophota bacterium]
MKHGGGLSAIDDIKIIKECCAIIPAYNEGRHIGRVIRKIKEFGMDVLVVDDGSHDDTAQVAENCGALVIRGRSNKGKGNALIRGFVEANKKKYKYFLTIDGDGQHDPQEIIRFFDKMERSDFDMIIGNRMHLPKDMPEDRFFINRKSSEFISKLCGQNIPDALCGYRLIKKNVLDNITLQSTGFEIVPEMLMKASGKGFKIGYVNIDAIYADEISHIRPWRDGYRFFKLLIREWIKR